MFAVFKVELEAKKIALTFLPTAKLVSGYLVLIIWSIDHNIAVQSVFSWAPWDPKVARKRKSKHWYACGADGRWSVGVRSRDYKIFLGWVDLLIHGAPLTRFARERALL